MICMCVGCSSWETSPYKNPLSGLAGRLVLGGESRSCSGASLQRLFPTAEAGVQTSSSGSGAVVVWASTGLQAGENAGLDKARVESLLGVRRCLPGLDPASAAPEIEGVSSAGTWGL